MAPATHTTGGSLTIGRFFGAPIRVHWTAPLGALVFGRFEFVPAFWLAFFGLILFHELGHAVVVRAVRARLHTVDIHGAGGLCHWSGEVTDIERALIAWGGILAQVGILFVAIAFVAILGRPTNAFEEQLWRACTTANLWLIAINLIPVAPLDGAEAWRLFSLLHARLRTGLRRRRARRHAAAERRRLSLAHARARLRQLDARDADQAATAAADAVAQRMIEHATKARRSAR